MIYCSLFKPSTFEGSGGAAVIALASKFEGSLFGDIWKKSCVYEPHSHLILHFIDAN